MTERKQTERNRPEQNREMGNTINHSANENVPSREVMTKYGPVMGKRFDVPGGEKHVDAFLGVPYAKPPVGNLRFAKPEPPEPWTEVRRTNKFGPRGIQKDFLYFIKWKYGETSEDCLYLNVFSPVWEPPPGGFPVMVFVHGGAFVSDSTVKYGDAGICKHLVPHGVVVVTVQYRLGYLGFFSTGDSACPDNLAMWDLTQALKWVNENIGAFAGNPNNITLFGQSAGGALVDLLSLSPHSRDLFHKLIPMSGNASADWAVCENAVEICRSHAASIGVEEFNSDEMIKKLRELDAMKFATSMMKMPGKGDKMGVEISPRIDGQFFPRPLSQLRAEAPSKPTLIGVCEYESLVFKMFDRQGPPVSINTFQQFMANRFPERKYEKFKQLREEALRLYIDPEADRNDKSKLHVAHTNILSDFTMNSSVQDYALARLNQGHDNVYLYSFDYCNPNGLGPLSRLLHFKGATHCTDLGYLFNVGVIMDFKFNEDDYKMLAIMTKLWTNFAKYGNPNGPPDAEDKFPFEWLPVDKENPQRSLSIKLKSEMKPFHNDRPLFWVSNKKTDADGN